MKCITNRASENHITPLQDAMWHRGIMGIDTCVFDYFDAFKATIVSNNEIRIASGIGAIQGRFFCVEPGTYDVINIANGAQGEKRIDIICAEYTVDTANDTQDCKWVVLQGESTTGNPKAPATTKEDIDNGGLIRQETFYEVHIEGITITEVVSKYQLWTLPIINGGSGANNRVDANKNLTELPKNTLPSKDTPVEWAKLGNFVCYYDSGATFPNRATTLGTLEQTVHTDGNWVSVHQIWKQHGQAEGKGKIYWRTGNAIGWNSSADVNGFDAWTKLLTEDSSVTIVEKAGTSLNDYVTFGWYYFTPAYAPTDTPNGNDGWLEVIPRNDGTIKQIWYRNGVPNTSDHFMLFRTLDSGVWSEWHTILTDKNGITMEVLWRNASPSSEFAAQTIKLDLSKYDKVLIQSLYGTSGYVMESKMFNIGETGILQYVYLFDTSPYRNLGNRVVIVGKTGIEFKDNENLMTAYSKFNTRNIPIAIYGIKGVI